MKWFLFQWNENILAVTYTSLSMYLLNIQSPTFGLEFRHCIGLI